MRLRPLLRPVLRPLLRLPTEDSRGFWPGMLFANGEQGFLYINDISTMYQDSAGTTPAAVDQPVGKWLDVSGRGNHATQPTSANRPTLKQDARGNCYVHFNGTNQWMQTGSVDLTATDKMTVFAGVTKLSDAAVGMLLESSIDALSNNGAVTLRAPQGASTYGLGGRGTVAGEVYATPGNFAATVSNVLTTQFDFAQAAVAGQLGMRVNGAMQALAASVAGPTGLGNFGSYPVYLGARAGSSFFFNGDIYCLSARGAATNDTLIAQAERWINARMGGVF